MSSKRSSRREFMKETLIAGEAAALTLWASREAAAQSAARQPYKIGILGCGNRSKAHIAALNDVPEIDVAALCDLVGHKMDQWAKLIKKKSADPRKYADMEKMLAQEDLDAVAIVLPNHLHKMAAIAALQAGKHVFCEKPMALTVADCNEMIAAAERAKKALQIGTQRRHAIGYQKAIEIIRSASLGKILSSDVNSYRGDWREPEPDEYPAGTKYWRMDQSRCGGVVYEMGAHVIDVNNWIFDSEPVTVACLQGVNDSALRQRDSTDHAALVVRYANGALMNYGGNLYTYAPPIANHFFAVNGTFALSDSKLEITYGHAKGVPSKERLADPLKMDLPGDDGTGEQWKHFAKVLAGKAAPNPDGRAGRQSIQICEASVISWRESRIVNVKDLG